MVTRVFESCFLFLNFVPSSSTSDCDMLCVYVPSVLFKIRVTIYWVSNMWNCTASQSSSFKNSQTCTLTARNNQIWSPPLVTRVTNRQVQLQVGILSKCGGLANCKECIVCCFGQAGVAVTSTNRKGIGLTRPSADFYYSSSRFIQWFFGWNMRTQTYMIFTLP